MFMTILDIFNSVIAGFKNIIIDLGFIQVSFFDLFIGVFIISCISKLVLRWLLDNRDIQIDLTDKFRKNLDTTYNQTDIWTFETDYKDNWNFRSKETFFE